MSAGNNNHHSSNNNNNNNNNINNIDTPITESIMLNLAPISSHNMSKIYIV